MVRISIAVALVAALASCGGETTQATADGLNISTQAVADTRNARDMFGRMSTASAQRATPIGSYAKGCQAGAVQLPETGPTWQAMRLSRNRNWTQPGTVGFVQDLSRFAATQPGWAGLYIGDMSQPRGGPVPSHASHQTGLDTDIWMLPPKRLNLSTSERESLSSISMRRSGGAFTNSNWTPQHEAILRRAASDPRVGRIFIFPGAKVAMCNSATGDRSWLNKIRPWTGHYSHFHVRLNCSDGAENCVNQAPPPPGDGCADAQAWVNNILNPPPPDPNPTPRAPRAALTLANLPAQCMDVLNN